MAKKQTDSATGSGATGQAAQVVMLRPVIPNALVSDFTLCPGLKHMVFEGQDVPGMGKITAEQATVTTTEAYAAFLCAEAEYEGHRIRHPLARRP